MTLSGEITAFLDILRTEQGDDAALPVFAMVNFPSEKDEFTEGGNSVRMYLTARDEGTVFVYQNRRLIAIMFFFGRTADYGAYPRPDALIDGLPVNVSRAQVREMFGEREAGHDGWDRFAIGENYLHVTYDEDGILTELTVMSEVPR